MKTPSSLAVPLCALPLATMAREPEEALARAEAERRVGPVGRVLWTGQFALPRPLAGGE